MTNFSAWIKKPSWQNKMIILSITLLIVDLILVMNASFGYVQDLSGQIKQPDEVRYAGIRSLFIGIPFFSILFGSILGLFVWKKKKYKERFINSSLLMLIIFYFLLLILGIRNLILW